MQTWNSYSCATDNGKRFDNPKFSDICEGLEIYHHITAVKHPQDNGQVEITNQCCLMGPRNVSMISKGYTLISYIHCYRPIKLQVSLPQGNPIHFLNRSTYPH